MIPSLLPGARVGIVLPTGRVLADVLLDAWNRGLVAVPINPLLPASQIDFILTHAQVHALVTTAGPTIVDRFGWLSDEDDDRLIIYTSGSTGDPKGVVLTRRAVEHNARAVAALHGFGPDRPHATCLPFFHCNALCMSLLGTHLTGTPLVIAPPDPPGLFEAIRAGGARTASLVPAILERVVNAGLPWPGDLDYFITAAAPLSRRLATAFRDLYGTGRLVQGFGMTEAVNFSCVMPPGLTGPAWELAYLVSNIPPVGVPLPETELRISPTGEVELRGPNLMRCYWRNPEATAAAFTPDGWLRSGDLGEFTTSGRLVLRGRAKETIKQGGGTVYPRDVEEALAAAGAPGVVAFAVETSSGEEEIGAVGPQIPGIDTLTRARMFRPMFFEEVPAEHTATGKPRRRAMSSRAVCEKEDPARYEGLLAAARETGRRLRTICPVVTGPAATFIAEASKELVAAPAAPADPDWASAPGRALNALQDAWGRIAAGELSGPDLFRGHPGLWSDLMTSWPMGSYAQLAARFLRARGLLAGRVLELGAGVGNTTALIASDVHPDRYVRTDLFPQLLSPKLPGRAMKYDFDQPAPAELHDAGPFDCVFATNALHCAVDVGAALSRIREELLAPGGTLLLAEGAPYPLLWDSKFGCAQPWALTFLFGLMPGWFDRGGFLSRNEWMGVLVGSGFHNLGYAVLRAGRYDLGGLVWAINPR